MKVGTRVRVHAPWNTFFGQEGVIAQTQPFVMVLLDSLADKPPMRLDDGVLLPVEEEQEAWVLGE